MEGLLLQQSRWWGKTGVVRVFVCPGSRDCLMIGGQNNDCTGDNISLLEQPGSRSV